MRISCIGYAEFHIFLGDSMDLFLFDTVIV